MSKSQNRGRLTQAHFVRPGEGDEINVVVNEVATSVGLAYSFGIDASTAPVPDRKYTADACAIMESRGTVKFLFGQERIDGDVWRSVLVVQLSRESAGRFLAMVNAIQGPSLDEIAAITNIQPESLASKPREPEQAIALSANLGIVAMAATEACIDFYQASPFALGSMIKSKKLAVDPVVRVDLRSSLFFALVNGIRDLDIPAPEILVEGSKP